MLRGGNPRKMRRVKERMLWWLTVKQTLQTKWKQQCSNSNSTSNCCSVTQLCLTLCDPMDCSTPGFPVLSGVSSNSHPLSRWCHPTISSSVVPFSSCLQSFLTSGSFPESRLFASGGQIVGASASSVLPMNIQGWFLLGLTGLVSLLSKGLSRVFSSTTIQRHQYFSAQLFLLSTSHIHTWLPENPCFDYSELCRQSNVSAF